MKKGKLDNLLSPSSSWRENPYPSRKTPKSAATTTASADRCLPGFFHCLFSTLHSRRKSLTFGSKKREQRIAVSASPAEAKDGFGSRSDAPTATVTVPPDRDARPEAVATGETTTTTTRLNLVGALEKCDRDLAELQKTIDVIKTTFLLHQKLSIPPAAPAPETITPSKSVTGDVVCQQTRYQTTNITPPTDVTQTDTDTDTMIFRADKNIKPNTANVNIVKINNYNVCRGNYKNNMIITSKRSSWSSSPAAGGVVRTVSRSMVESVDQVCDDVACGEKREVGRIGLALQDHICRDLIDETVRELSPFSSASSSPPPPWLSRLSGGRRRHRRRASGSLPLDACRRRLVF